jgi:uncharacterized protein
MDILTLDNMIKELIQKEIYLFKKDDLWVAYGIFSGIILKLTDTEAEIILGLKNCKNIINYCQISKFESTEIFNLIRKIFEKLKNKKLIVEKLPSFNSLLLLISENCNLSCTYCYGSYNTKRKALMDYETAKKALDFAHSLKIDEIAFFGGEPLLNFELIKKVVAYSNEKGYKINFSMTTNATLVNKEIAAFCKNFGIQVSVSIDGPRETHNLTRVYDNGRGSYDDVINGIKLLKEFHVLQALEITYSDKHPEDISRLIDPLITYSHKISCSCVDGKKDSQHFTETIRGERLKTFYRELIEYTRNNKQVHIGGISEAVDSLSSSIQHVHPYICYGLMQRAVVDVKGNIYPCPETVQSEYCFGNIYDENIENIINNNGKRVLASFMKENYKQYWFSNLFDTCIVRVKDKNNNTIVMEDEEIIGECAEQLILAALSTSKIN